MEVWDWMLGYYISTEYDPHLSGGEGGSERVSVALTGVKAAACTWGSLPSQDPGVGAYNSSHHRQVIGSES